MIGQLPQSLEVNGRHYAIRSDFRDVLNILCAFSDPELEDKEKVYTCLFILYEDFDSIPADDYEAAFKAALAFIDNGVKEEDKKSPRVMDWEQDANLLFPAINKVAGREVRSEEYIHWWTFIGYYMEISEGVYSTIISLRLKRRKARNWKSGSTNSGMQTNLPASLQRSSPLRSKRQRTGSTHY